LYHLVYTQYILQGSTEHQVTHLLLGFSLFFLHRIMVFMEKRKHWVSIVALILVWVMGLVCLVYLQIYSEEIEARGGFGTPTDLIMGALLIVGIWVGSWLSFGPVIALLAVGGTAYFLWGYLLPGVLGHMYVSPADIMVFLVLGYEGVFGIFMLASADYIFLFLIFGVLISVTGGKDLFIELGRAVGRYLTGGSGQTAVISSGLVGSITGVAMANVAITGSFTIPAMKREGYRPEQAGAIEAVASTGGQIMPPVMGIAAFLMALLVGVAYIEICKAALLSAILYYVGTAMGVRAMALRLKIGPKRGAARVAIDWKKILKLAPGFFIPLALVVTLLIQRHSVMFVAFWAIVTTLALSFLQRETRKSWREYLGAATDGAIQGGAIAIIAGCMGIIVKSIVSTGLAVKFGHMFEILSFGIPILFVVWSMVFAILLGCGAPTLAAYALVAAMMAPLMIQYLGISIMQAHLFVMYFAVISAITPPVAAAALVAAQISGVHYMKVGWESVKLAVGLFLLPYFFIHNPALLLAKGATVWDVVFVFLIALGDLWLWAGAIQGFSLTSLRLPERFLCGLGAVSLVVYVIYSLNVTLVIGLGILAGMVVWEKILKGRLQVSSL
ncbi:TRAP transporter permease, partial [Chloroflexota bacterium]